MEGDDLDRDFMARAKPMTYIEVKRSLEQVCDKDDDQQRVLRILSAIVPEINHVNHDSVKT
jgi:hypothetical protein